MPKQTDKQPEKEKNSSRAPETAAVSQSTDTGIMDLVTSPTMGADIQGQSAQLSDGRFSTVQRQMMAGQMANLHGNQHMLRVIQGLSARPNVSARNGATGAIQMKAADAQAEEAEGLGGSSSPDSASTSAPPPGDEVGKEALPVEVMEVDGGSGGSAEENKIPEMTPPTPKEPADFSAVVAKELPSAADAISLQGANPAVGDAQAETQAVKAENMADAEAGLSDINAANNEVAAQKDAAAAQSQATDGELEATLGGLSELAGSELAFAPVEEEEEEGESDESGVIFRKEIDPDGGVGDDPTPDPQVNAALASARVSQFVSSNSGEVARITALGQTVQSRLMPLAEDAKAAIQAEVEARISAVLQAIATARVDVMTHVGTAKTDIQGQHDTAVTGIKAATVEAKNKVDTDYQTKLNDLTTLQTTETPKIEKVFDDAAKGVRDAAVTKGKDAQDIATRKKADFDKETPPPPPDEGGFLNAVSDVADFLTGDTYGKNWIQAKKNAADSVASEYQKQFSEKAEQTAAQILNGKQEGASAVQKTVEDTRKALETEKNTAIKEIEQAETDALKTASDTLTEQLGLVDQSLQGALDNLDSLETTFPEQLRAAGEQQKLGVDRDVQQIATAIQQAISESSNSLLQGLQSLASQVQSVPAPDLAQLDQYLNNAQGQFSGAIAQSEAGIEAQLSTAEGQISLMGPQGVETIATQGESMLTQVTPIAADFATSITELVNSSGETFKQVETGHTDTVNQKATDTATHFQQLYDYGKGEIEAIQKHLETEMGKTVTDFSAGLDTSLKEIEPKIITEADAAAAKVQPSWKRFVALVLTVVITVLVAVAIAALVASGVGFVAGLLIAAAIGAAAGLMKQALTNWSTGEPLSKDLVKAAVLGALDGMLQFAGGRFVKGFKFPETGFSFKKLATEAAVNTVSGIVNDLAGLAWDGKLTWESAGQTILANLASGLVGLGGSALTSKLSIKWKLDGANLTSTQKWQKAAMDVGLGTVFDTAGDKELWQKAMKGELTWDDIGNSARKNALTNVVKTGTNSALEAGDAKKKLTDFANNKIKPVEDNIKGLLTGGKSTPTTSETTTTPPAKVDDDTTTTTKPPVTEEEVTTTKPPVAEEEVTTTKPPVTEEEVTTTKPPVTEEEVTTTKPPVAEEEVTTTKPPVAEEEVTTTKPPVAEEEVTTTKPPVTEEEVTTTKPPVAEEEVTTTKPPVAEEEVTTTKPPVNEDDVTTTKPPVNEDDVVVLPVPPKSSKDDDTKAKNNPVPDKPLDKDTETKLPIPPAAAELGNPVSHHDYANPGPLADDKAATFTGHRYTVVELTEDTVLYRAGVDGKPLGQFFSKDMPVSEIQARIDKAVLPVWASGDKSPMDTVYTISIPKGTKVYVGEVANQGGFYVGGTQQIVVLEPWKLPGVQVVSQQPLVKDGNQTVALPPSSKPSNNDTTTTPKLPVTDDEVTTPKLPVTNNEVTTPKLPVTEDEVTTPKPPVTDDKVTTPKPPVTDDKGTTPKLPVTDDEGTTPKLPAAEEEAVIPASSKSNKDDEAETKTGTKNETEPLPQSNKTPKQVLDEHVDELAKWPHLEKALYDIDKMPDGPAKQQRLAQLETDLMDVRNNTRPLASISPELARVAAKNPEVADMVNQVVQKHGQAGVDLLKQYFNGDLVQDIGNASQKAGIPQQYLQNMMDDPALGEMVIGLRPSNVKFLDDEVRKNTYPKTPVDVLMPDGTVAKASSQSAVVFKTDKETGLVKVMVDVGGVQVPHGVVKGDDGVWRAVPLADLHQDGKINMQYGLPMGPDVDLYFILGKGQNNIIDWKEVDPVIMGSIIKACGEQRSTGEMLSAIQHGAHVPYMADKMASALNGADSVAVYRFLHDKILADNGLVYVGERKKFLWVPGSSIPILYDILGHKFPGK